MAINAAKTGLMLVSAASSFEAWTRLTLGDETVTGKASMKILGVTLDHDASFKTHITKLSARLRSETWALCKLRKKGLSEDKLVRTYKNLIRPTVEYACPAWHSCLTAAQAAQLEKQQTQALKNIFGYKISAAKLRMKADVDLLSKRREAATKKFAIKSLTNSRSRSWFVRRRDSVYPRRTVAAYPTYREDQARTDRHRNNPKNYLVRKANEA